MDSQTGRLGLKVFPSYNPLVNASTTAPCVSEYSLLSESTGPVGPLTPRLLPKGLRVEKSAQALERTASCALSQPTGGWAEPEPPRKLTRGEHQTHQITAPESCVWARPLPAESTASEHQSIQDTVTGRHRVTEWDWSIVHWQEIRLCKNQREEQEKKLWRRVDHNSGP